jgi:hypothetical protein
MKENNNFYDKEAIGKMKKKGYFCEKDFIYRIVEENYLYNDDIRTSYGIAVYSNANKSGAARIVASIHDITSDRDRLSHLVKKCNDLHLLTIHLHDVVEDFLIENN